MFRQDAQELMNGDSMRDFILIVLAILTTDRIQWLLGWGAYHRSGGTRASYIQSEDHRGNTR